MVMNGIQFAMIDIFPYFTTRNQEQPPLAKLKLSPKATKVFWVSIMFMVRDRIFGT